MGTFNPLTELREWHRVFGELPENALAQRLKATAPLSVFSQQRDGSIPGATALLAVIFFCWLLMLLGHAAGLLMGESGIGMLFDIGSIINYSLLLPFSLLWFFAALFSCARLSLGFLAGDSAAGSQSVDDLLLLTSIERRELLAALLSACFKRMATPLLLLSISISFTITEILYDGYGMGASWLAERPGVGLALLNLPFILVPLLVGSMLSLLILCLLLLLLGRGMASSALLNIAAGYMTFLQLGWLLVCYYIFMDLTVLNSGIQHVFRSSTPWLNVAMGLTVLLCSAAYLWLCALSSLRSRVGAALLLFLSPVLVVLLAIGGLLLTDDYHWTYGQLAINLLWSLNLASVPSASLFAHNHFVVGRPEGNLLLFPLMEIWRVPLMLTVQLLLLLALGRIGIAACEPRSRFE